MFNPWVRKIPWRRKLATHSSILAWRITWTEEPGGLQSMGSKSQTHVHQPREIKGNHKWFFFFLTEQCPNLKWNIVDFFSLKLTSSFFLYAAHFLFCLVLFFKCVCLWRKHVENLCIAIKQRLLLLCHYRCRWLTRNDYLKPYVSVFFSELLPLCIPTGVHKCIFVSLA